MHTSSNFIPTILGLFHLFRFISSPASPKQNPLSILKTNIPTAAVPRVWLPWQLLSRWHLQTCHVMPPFLEVYLFLLRMGFFGIWVIFLIHIYIYISIYDIYKYLICNNVVGGIQRYYHLNYMYKYIERPDSGSHSKWCKKQIRIFIMKVTQAIHETSSVHYVFTGNWVFANTIRVPSKNLPRLYIGTYCNASSNASIAFNPSQYTLIHHIETLYITTSKTTSSVWKIKQKSPGK